MPDQEIVKEREIVNLDFSVVLPDGYTAQEIPEEGPFIFRAAGEDACIALEKPVEIGGEMDFTRPAVKGVIRNVTAREFIRCYGRDIPQKCLISQKDLMVVCGTRSDDRGDVHYMIATGKGMYRGMIHVKTSGDRNRLTAAEKFLTSITMYQMTPEEAQEAEKRAAREAKKRKEELAKRAEISRGAALDSVIIAQAQQRNAEELKRIARDQALAEEEARKRAKEREERIRAREEERVARLQEEARQRAEKKAAGQAEPAAMEQQTADLAETSEQPANRSGAAEHRPAERAESAAAAKSAADGAEAAAQERVNAEKPKNKEDSTQLTPEQKEILQLEEKRSLRTQKLREKYQGNPEEELEVDHLIAQLDRESEEVIGHFHEFLGWVQDVFNTTPFTGEDDPKLLDLFAQIHMNIDGFGQQLDQMTDRLDEVGTKALAGGIREACVIRLIKFAAKLDGKYRKLAVRFNEENRVSYARPAETDEIFDKWQKTKMQLPSCIEEADVRRERAVTESLQAQMDELVETMQLTRANVQQLAGEKETAQEEQLLAQENLNRFLDDEEERKAGIHEEEKRLLEQIRKKLDENRGLLQAKQEEILKLRDEFEHTFVLSGRKKQLQAEVEKAEDEERALKEETVKLTESRESAADNTGESLKALEDEKRGLEERLRIAEAALDKAGEKLTQAQKELEEQEKKTRETNEAFSHVHRDFLRGRYDDFPMPGEKAEAR